MSQPDHKVSTRAPKRSDRAPPQRDDEGGDAGGSEELPTCTLPSWNRS